MSLMALTENEEEKQTKKLNSKNMEGVFWGGWLEKEKRRESESGVTGDCPSNNPPAMVT